VSLRTDDFQETSTEKYIPIHIICVIDVSGSMQGEKIKLVKASLEYVVGKMSAQDRITLIAFNQEATVLAEYAQAEDMAVRIQKLTAGGNTNIRQGLEYAYNVVKKYAKERMMQSIWLLTDGQDTNGFTGKDVAPQLLSHFGGKSCPFVAHTFGYGRDHDPTIMKMLSKAQSGNFKYIENTLELADAVGTALGGAESAIAREVTIVVKPGKF
jgi:Mg-chelatase subunit ChlD